GRLYCLAKNVVKSWSLRNPSCVRVWPRRLPERRASSCARCNCWSEIIFSRTRSSPSRLMVYNLDRRGYKMSSVSTINAPSAVCQLRWFYGKYLTRRRFGIGSSSSLVTVSTRMENFLSDPASIEKEDENLPRPSAGEKHGFEGDKHERERRQRGFADPAG